MTTKAQIDEFLRQKTLAFAGISRAPGQFANRGIRGLFGRLPK